MRVTIIYDYYGERSNKNYVFIGLKRKPAIVKAVECYRNDIMYSRYPILDFKTSRS